MKHVVHLTSVHTPFDVRILLKECRSLAQAGYRVTLVAPHDRDELVDGVQIVAVPKPRHRVERMTRTQKQIYRQVLRLDADLYHFHDPELIPIGLLLRARGKQVVYDVHEDVPGDILLKPYLPTCSKRPVSWLAKNIQDIAAHRLSAIVAATPSIGTRFEAINPQSIVVNNYALVNEVTLPTRMAWNNRQNAATYVGTGFTVTKGLANMVEAIGYLPEHLGATLELAGTFASDEQRAWVTKVPGWSRVRELGLLSRSEVARLLGRVRAGLLLLHPTSNYIWTVPTKLFEYMSASIPVIVSDFPLWRELIGPIGCGLLVDPLDTRAITTAIEFVFTHPEEAEAMGRRGREAVEKHYNWESEFSKLLQLYECLVHT